MSEGTFSQFTLAMDSTDALATSQSEPGKRSRSRARLESRRDYLIGIALLLVVVVLWTSSNFLTQGLFEDGYEKPFFVTYLNTSSFALYLLPFVIRRSFKRYQSPSYQNYSDYEPLVTDEHAAEALGAAGVDGEPSTSDSTELPPLTTRETARLAAYFCLLWFIANWTLNASLDYTSVASATILSSMSGFFTLGIGRIFRVEKLTVVKLAAVFASFGGVVLVSLSDSSQSQSSSPPSSSPSPSSPYHNSLIMFSFVHIIGDALALLSALFYALYVILLKVRIRSESRIDMQLFFGFVGLFNIIACWPLGVVLHFAGVERFELPYSSKAVTALLVNMAITLSSDYIYVLAMLKTTPLVVTIGLSLTMPLAVLGDFMLAKPAKAQVIVGAAVVLCSFILVGLEDARQDESQGLFPGQEEVAVRLEEEVVVDP
ncbi:hypothetical protein WOLCODRAFT_135344 [Wolfiporia cocos MD-104 SS10]|uniref:Uncharacterized protein n=1 Tax=Wolfiporia cocos (strain MD-104) TaxID=742152 RepID=A0A2H3JCZ7_WOLCO|nr:hypothetical protein WOLCODRAFT_135344 [Wolfiporia cocos MD-104 SS10]